MADGGLEEKLRKEQTIISSPFDRPKPEQETTSYNAISDQEFDEVKFYFADENGVYDVSQAPYSLDGASYAGTITEKQDGKMYAYHIYRMDIPEDMEVKNDPDRQDGLDFLIMSQGIGYIPASQGNNEQFMRDVAAAISMGKYLSTDHDTGSHVSNKRYDFLDANAADAAWLLKTSPALDLPSDKMDDATRSLDAQQLLQLETNKAPSQVFAEQKYIN